MDEILVLRTKFCTQQSAARDGKQRGGFSKSVVRAKSGGISKFICPACLPPLSRGVLGRAAPGEHALAETKADR